MTSGVLLGIYPLAKYEIPVRYKREHAIAYVRFNPRRHRPFRILPRHRGGGGGWYDPLAVSPLIKIELRGKKRACSSPRDEEIDI